MSWPQVAALAVTILFGIIAAFWSVLRPLVKALFETVVVGRLDSLEEKIDAMREEHGTRIRDIELEQAKLKGALEARGCLAVPRDGNPVSRCAP